jgi:anti-sigma factor RsiW
MKCSEVAELLKSDYLDGEVSPEISREVKAHLAECPECWKLEQEIAAGRGVFQKTRRLVPPERVWQNIRSAIAGENEEQDDPAGPGVIERLKLFIWPPKPVFAWSGALTVLIVAAIVSGGIWQNIRLAAKSHDADILADYSLNAENSEHLASLGTNIEEYFL